MPQLDTTYIVSQLFWLSVFFTVFLLFIRYVIIPKMDQVYSERRKIKDDSEKATQDLMREIENLKRLHTKKADALREEIQSIKRDSSRNFDEYSSKATDKLNKKMNAAFKKTEEEIAQLKSLSFDSAESQNLIVENAQKIIDKISGLKIKKQDLEKLLRSGNA